jgi:hypothetical protein
MPKSNLIKIYCEIFRRLSIQANFLNSLNYNGNKENIDLTDSSESDISEDSNILEDKLNQEEYEEVEYSPLKETTYNNCKFLKLNF